MFDISLGGAHTQGGGESRASGALDIHRRSAEADHPNSAPRPAMASSSLGPFSSGFSSSFFSAEAAWGAAAAAAAREARAFLRASDLASSLSFPATPMRPE